MKKKILLLVISLGVLLVLAGCSKKEEDSDKDNGAKATEGAENENDSQTENDDNNGQDKGNIDEVDSDLILENTLTKGSYMLEDHIMLGQYKGIEVKIDKLTVTDEMVNAEIQKSMIESDETAIEITDRAIQAGDIANIDFTGYKDGVEFEGGEDTDFDLAIGSQSFIDGFEDNLIGVETGKTVDINITFPQDYQAAELAGQDVVFTVTVNSIRKYDITNEYIIENTDFDSVDAFTNAIREKIELGYENLLVTQKQNSVFNAILEDSEIISIPQTLIDYYKTEFFVYYSQMALAYQMNLSDIYTGYGMDETKFEEVAVEYAESVSTQELVLEAIIAAESLVITDDEFDEEVSNIVEQYGYPSNEEFLAEQDEELVRQNILYEKAMEFVVEEAIEI